ncbi:hypothetical protein [Streptomyces sp. NPDC048272]|uniref:hypothetical protein n=1 Tax=Streptomyces sp. NPDC048272 TaxID=3154616 RepID=UPI00341DAFB8
MYVITCPNSACKAPGAELISVPVPHTDEHVDAALCTKCEKVWGLDPGADGSCPDCGGSGTVGATGPGSPLCPCHESHTDSLQLAGRDLIDTADPDEPSASTPSMTWRRTAAVLLASIVAAGITLAAGAEVAWWVYQHPADLPGVDADGTPHNRFLWAFFVGAMATIAIGSLGGAAVDRIERWGTASPTWR